LRYKLVGGVDVADPFECLRGDAQRSIDAYQ
jgi:hypothetical protein